MTIPYGDPFMGSETTCGSDAIWAFLRFCVWRALETKQCFCSRRKQIGRFPAFCHGSSLALRRTAHATAAAASPVFGRSEKSNDYGNPASDFTAVADLQNYFYPRGYLTESRTHRTTRRYGVARTLRKVSRTTTQRP